MNDRIPPDGRVPWSAGRWTHEPLSARELGDSLIVHAAPMSDAWRTTSYGFIHESEHALVRPVSSGVSIEVSFEARFERQFDQAGVFVRADAAHWIKAGVELVDGTLQLGAVVTNGSSDWSVAPVTDWAGRSITIRVSIAGNAVTVRARAGDDRFQLVRVAPLPEAQLEAGPFCCAPTGPGLEVTFVSWRETAGDGALHEL